MKRMSGMKCLQTVGPVSCNMAGRYVSLLCLCFSGVLALGAKPASESPVAPGGSLVRVGEVFSLPDGPAWDGSSELIVSDVKDQSVHCYRHGRREKLLPAHIALWLRNGVLASQPCPSKSIRADAARKLLARIARGGTW